jgi:hypothetical protein
LDNRQTPSAQPVPVIWSVSSGDAGDERSRARRLLCRFLLAHFSNATAVCQDGSEAMVRLGRERMARLKGRVKFVLCDFSKSAGAASQRPFDAASLIASTTYAHETIRAIYDETFRW